MKITLKKPKLNFKLSNLSKFFVNIGSNQLSQIFVLFIVLIGINVFSQKYFLRLDLTETNTYTLSQGTKNILISFENTLTIDVYFSDNIPPDLIQVKQDSIDTFEEYVRYSNGKIELNIKNSKDENFKTDANNAGIPEVQYQDYSNDTYEIATGYLGASITYNDQTEVIEMITTNNIKNIEYETSSRIYNLVNDEKIKVAFLTGHGEKSIYSYYSTIYSELSKQFSIESIDLSEGEPIDSGEIKVLIIAAPTDVLSERDMFEIDQYIIHGGRVIILSDQYEFSTDSAVMTKTASNLDEFIKNYGIELSNSLVLDESYLPLQMIFTYPYWVLTQSENINKDNPALSQLNSIVFFWANYLKEAKTNDNQEITNLIQTTNKAWINTGDNISVDPSQQFFISSQTQYPLAMLIEGKQVSAYKDQEIPALEGDSEDKRTDKDTRIDEIDDSRIIVIGDSDFITNDLIGGSEQNPTLFLNLVEWMASSENLLEIRSKNIETRSLNPINESQKLFVKTLIIIAAPTIIIALGITYNILRKKRKTKFSD